jgi:methylaspartate ammonia-lyase
VRLLSVLPILLTACAQSVGDDQQTAPEYIGVTDEEVQNAISKYLQDIPHKEFYGTTGSILNDFGDFTNNDFRFRLVLNITGFPFYIPSITKCISP